MIPLDPRVTRVGTLLSARGIEWAVAGGWAIDIFLGRVTRPHADVDLAIWRDAQHQLRVALLGWKFAIANSGRLHPWTGTRLRAPLHEIHATNADGNDTIELLLNDRDDREWIYRRDARVRLPLGDAIRHDGALPFLAPELVLLYKSKRPRASDHLDFQHTLPRLSPTSREWLSDALALVDSEHPWLSSLRTG